MFSFQGSGALPGPAYFWEIQVLDIIEHKQDSQDGGSVYFVMAFDQATGMPDGLTFHIVPKQAAGQEKIKVVLDADLDALRSIGAAMLSWALMSNNGKTKIRGAMENEPDTTAYAQFWMSWTKEGDCVITATEYDGQTSRSVSVTFKRADVFTKPDGSQSNDSVAMCEWTRLAAWQMLPSDFPILD